MKQEKLDYFYNWLLDRGAFTQSELRILMRYCGHNIETLDMAVCSRYGRYGYQTVQDLIDLMNDSKQD